MSPELPILLQLTKLGLIAHHPKLDCLVNFDLILLAGWRCREEHLSGCKPVDGLWASVGDTRADGAGTDSGTIAVYLLGCGGEWARDVKHGPGGDHHCTLSWCVCPRLHRWHPGKVCQAGFAFYLHDKFERSVLPIISLPYWSFQLYISLWISSSLI